MSEHQAERQWVRREKPVNHNSRLAHMTEKMRDMHRNFGSPLPPQDNGLSGIRDADLIARSPDTPILIARQNDRTSGRRTDRRLLSLTAVTTRCTAEEKLLS